jgi:hypothetical protein
MKTIPVRVPEDLHRRVRVKLAQEDRTLQDLLIAAIRDYVGSEPSDEEVREQVKVAQDLMKKYTPALRELAR